MRILIAPLENFILGEKTFFRSDVNSEDTSLDVQNAGNFKANQFIVLGTIGSETAEIKRIESISVNLKKIVLIGGATFNHKKGEPLQEIMFDQRKFYRSDAKDGDYIHLSFEGSPINIQVDVPEGTRFEDSSGTDEHYYKATYFNSYSSTETSLDDALPSKARDVEYYTSIYKIRSEAGLVENSYITSDLIHGYRVEAEAQIDGAIANMYQLPLTSPSKMIQHIATLLAAGHLLAKEYGMEADIEISKSGQRKIERAEQLLEKIANGDLLLVGEEGQILSRQNTFFASGSNVYSSDRADKGVLFNLEPEHFKFTDPDEPLSSSDRKKK